MSIVFLRSSTAYRFSSSNAKQIKLLCYNIPKGVNMKQIKPIIWGVAIIALGVIFGGNALGLFNLNVFFDGWWTLFIIIPSIISLVTEKEKLSSLGFLAAGVILLLAAQKVFDYDVAWKAILAVFCEDHKVVHREEYFVHLSWHDH